MREMSAFDSEHENTEMGLDGHKTEVHRSRFFEALRSFTQAPFTPWWTRIWVVQGQTWTFLPIKRKNHIAYMDKSISIATLSRRLMCGKGFAGSGPAEMVVGDEIFLLHGVTMDHCTQLHAFDVGPWERKTLWPRG